ncbi:hypothetical protein MACH09_42810 [Vibrio sp. MACH09]|uniref:DUF406 family protein n=1 Tax=unclassified Vibrio TaxID=2614977 RepID=UPI0014933B6F|nr:MULTISPECIES: DUF406 family protein [unclassified Vibrio]NOI66025.1 DUF406 family protein [Vibrio sp. 99-8-1]GLO63773.1 hypothetical protein MACH09_42810 [Vibrio sp. MACH09]
MTEETIATSAENELCEACGCSAEVGFIIKEGDEVAEVSLFAESKQALEAEFEKYTSLAKSINADVQFETSALTEQSTELHSRFKFDVSAEKLIFELKCRTLSR